MESRPLKVMTWNVLASTAVKYHENGKEETGARRNKRHDKIIRRIKKLDCDLVLLQEVDKNFYYKLRDTHYKVVWKLPPLKHKKNAFGNAILYNDTLKKQTKAETLIWGQDQTMFDRKNALFVKFRWGDKMIDVVSLHLSGRTAEARKRLFNSVISNVASPYCIIGGDFNCDTNQNCIETSLGSNSDGYTTCSFDYEPSHQPTEVDKILISTDLYFSGYRSEKIACSRMPHPYSKFGSDHFPVIAEISAEFQKPKKTRRRKSPRKSRRRKSSKKKIVLKSR